MRKFIIATLAAAFVAGVSHAQNSSTGCLSICNGPNLNTQGKALIKYAVTTAFESNKTGCSLITSDTPLFDCQALPLRPLGPHLSRLMKNTIVGGQNYCRPVISPNMTEKAARATFTYDSENKRWISPTFAEFVDQLQQLVAANQCKN